MTSLPLHPILVHFPIAFAVLLPFVLCTVAFLIWKRNWPARTWWTAIAFCGLFALSALISVKSGERDEELVEAVVSEQVIHHHEEMGERVVQGAVLLFLISLGPLFTSRRSLFYGLSLGISLLCLGLTLAAGHSGGELVYRHGAASAYAQTGQLEGAVDTSIIETGDREEDKDDD